jgi:hypothetical protein
MYLISLLGCDEEETKVVITTQEVIKAKTLLGLSQRATLAEIKLKYKLLMKQWHPDLNQDPSAHQMSIDINDAYKTILAYCDNYEFNFSEEEINRYISAEEWWKKKFF